MPTPFSPSAFALSVTLAISLVGCGTAPQPSVAPSPTATVRTEPTAEELTAAVRFRTTFGLRSDDPWIRAVFSDPASDNGTTFGVPLLPDEVAKVMAAQAAANATTDLVAAYGATVPQDWAGLFVDQTTGGTVVARFKANVDKHRSALLAILPAGAKVDVRLATWTDAELQGFMARVEEERDWFPTIGTTLFTVEIDVLDNLVNVRFDGLRASADAIEAHFGNPPWLRAVRNGPPEWTGARGELEIYAQDAAGRPVPQLDIVVNSEDDDRVDVNSESEYGTDERGHHLFRNLPAVAYRVRLFRGSGDEGRALVAEGRVLVPPNGRGSIRLIIK